MKPQPYSLISAQLNKQKETAWLCLQDQIVMAAAKPFCVEVLVDSPQPISLLEDESVNLNGPVPKITTSGAILDPPRWLLLCSDSFD